MRTKITIMGIVVGAMVLALTVLFVLIRALGLWVGLGVGIGIATSILLVYFLVVAPWQHRWGATDEEVGRTMPGDDLIPGAKSTTRAITIDADPGQVWPWLLQLGYGRGGWYSYDWIDNDGKPSADRIVPELQRLHVGDQIVMVSGMGPKVRAITPDEWILSGDHQEAGTWCIALYKGQGDTRLVSRWRQDWPITPASAFWILISDPGAFIMERKMLKGIKARLERRAVGAAA